MRLNIGSGSEKLEGYLNIDPYSDEADSKHNFLLLGSYPYVNNSVEEIVMYHCIEHIQERNHITFLNEFYRLLEPGGYLLISFPEFSKCAKNYIENYKGQRAFWKATIYGRQLHTGDYHISLMNSDEFRILLMQAGFENIEIRDEPGEFWNTVVRCRKGRKLATYEEIVAVNAKEISWT